MLNHTYTSVNNANLVDCGKKQHISSQPSPLLKDNFLGEFRTELDKKKVLANLGIASDLILEWENIKGDIGQSEALMKELDARTKYISDVVLTWENIKGDDVSKSKALVTELDARTTYVTKLGDFQNKVISVIDGLTYLETIVGGDQAAEAIQNDKIQVLETAKQSIETEISNIKTHLSGTIEVSIENIKSSIQNIDTQLANITSLITVSEKEGNALELLKGETPGLYVPDLSGRLQITEDSVSGLQQSISTIQGSLDTFVTKEQLGGDGEFDFVNQSDFSSFSTTVDQRLGNFESELEKTVKTGEDGHVNNLFVNKISKNNDDGNIKITDSFEVESGIPLDVRFVKETIKELLALPVELCYEGMGVIVNSLSSLYILRKPEEGVLFNQDYVSNINNWKCPEDLVTEVITRAKYDEYAKAGSLSPSIFYYIIEDVEDEPNPDLYVGGVDSEEYKAAFDRWLKYLQGQYMSGVWGQEIEKVVAGKASITAVNSLSSQITDLTKRVNLISGNVGNLNVEQVFTQVESNTQHINDLATKSEKLQQGITDLSNNVSTTYVTKQEITTEDPDAEYIFVKKSAFESYVQDHAEALKTGIETGLVKTPTITFSDDMSLSTLNGKIQANGDDVALVKEIPKIECKSKDEYDKLETKDINTYYYVYDESDRVVLDSEFSTYKQYQTNYLTTLSSSVTTNTNNIQILLARIEELSSELANLKNQINNSESE